MKIFTAFLLAVLFLSTLSSCLVPAEDPATSYYSESEPTTESVPSDTAESTVATESAVPFPTPAIKTESEYAISLIECLATPDEVIMSIDEIEAENERMILQNDTVYDLTKYNSKISASELKALLLKHSVPMTLSFDWDGSVISDEDKLYVSDNMNVDSIPETVSVQRAVAVLRGNLRRIPDDRPYLTKKNGKYDSIQQTEIHTGTPLLVFRTSKDGKYSFVMSYNYYGWIKSDDIALCDNIKLWKKFCEPENFVTVTDKELTVSEKLYDMGCILPLEAKTVDEYVVLVPFKNENGHLKTELVNVSPESLWEGYVPYTYENFIIQAFKYEGVDYSWGGYNRGVDCSSYVLNVFKTFGFKFPRDTKEQEYTVGSHQNTHGMGHDEIGKLLKNNGAPTVVYYPGHTLLYLGYDNNSSSYVFIHAPEIGDKVSVTKKTSLSGIRYVCEITK